MEQDKNDKIIENLELEAKEHDSGIIKIFKNKGEEIAATGKCKGEGVMDPNKYSVKLPEDQAEIIAKDVTCTGNHPPKNQDMLNKINKLIDDVCKRGFVTQSEKDELESYGYYVKIDEIDPKRMSISLKYQFNVDQQLDEYIKKIDSMPDPKISPCEESEKICEAFSEGKQRAEKRLSRQLALKAELDDSGETELNFKLTIKEKEKIKQKAKEYGFKNLSDYMRVVLLNAKIDVAQENAFDDLKNKFEDVQYGDLYYFMDKFIKDPSDLNYRRLVLLFDSVMVYKLNKIKE